MMIKGGPKTPKSDGLRNIFLRSRYNNLGTSLAQDVGRRNQVRIVGERYEIKTVCITITERTKSVEQNQGANVAKTQQQHETRLTVA